VPRKTPRATKRDFLRQQGTLNPHPEQVTDPLFQANEFFDPEDLVQVKYEMVRRVQVEKQSASQSAAAFGFSRPTFYQAQADLQRGGLMSLAPQKRGPHAGHKLTPAVLIFLQQMRASDPAASTSRLVEAVAARFGVRVHPRSIERTLLRHQKKLR
jgi:transposase